MAPLIERARPVIWFFVCERACDVAYSYVD